MNGTSEMYTLINNNMFFLNNKQGKNVKLYILFINEIHISDYFFFFFLSWFNFCVIFSTVETVFFFSQILMLIIIETDFVFALVHKHTHRARTQHTNHICPQAHYFISTIAGPICDKLW